MLGRVRWRGQWGGKREEKKGKEKERKEKERKEKERKEKKDGKKQFPATDIFS